MSDWFPFSEQIRLHVEGRISAKDAARQEATARAILGRLDSQPGVILADEVGMGKTFVALAVAASVALTKPRPQPVVVMVPSSLSEKWPADFELFREKCLPPELGKQLRVGRAQRAVEFLKFLDDPAKRRRSIIFLTHGALSHGLNDGWVKLALIYRAMYHRRNIAPLRRAVCRVAGRLLRMGWVDRCDHEIWRKLLVTPPEGWLHVMQTRGFDPEGNGTPESADDPLPQPILDVLPNLNLEDLYQTLDAYVPRKQSKHFEDNLVKARRQIAREIRIAWQSCIEQARYKLPLLILDEAHHLKNAQTKLASLFHVEEAESDMEEITRGPLSGVFERMLFLTATPFQLGHHELCSVLDRFEGINWKSKRPSTIGRGGYANAITELRTKLDRAQEAAVAFDRAWGRLKLEDLAMAENGLQDVNQWWASLAPTAVLSPSVSQAVSLCHRTRERMREAESLLQPWVIRHLKPRSLPDPFVGIARRRRITGEAILTDCQHELSPGLNVDGHALLPFLLAARATACTPQSRPVFAEGLASSYEAFMHTRKHRAGDKTPQDPITDLDDDPFVQVDMDDRARWYLTQLEEILPHDKPGLFRTHPKVAATVKRIVETWLHGEKVVVFCHYIATGRALRQWVCEAIAKKMAEMAADKMGVDPEQAMRELERLGDRFFDPDSPIRRSCDAEVNALLEDYPTLHRERNRWIDIVRRNLRTPSFLVRYFPLSTGQLTADAMAAALDTRDLSGMSLRDLVRHFFEFLEHRCGAKDRQRYMEAMGSIQVGAHAGVDVAQLYTPDETQGDHIETLLANVRLVNGSTKPDTRQRLMLAFNTPFFPEVLITSSVMAEGVDLHLSCRHIIHHDLCWNPSTLEQRTGAFETRIGAKVEQSGKPIFVYLPYVAETQDEKMYRVVMDRERWFNVVMGEQYQVDAQSTDALAERIPLPAAVSEELAFRLDLDCQLQHT